VQSIIQAASTPKVALQSANFSVLHNMTKDTLYLEENIDALLLTVERAIQFHSKNLSSCHCDIVADVHNNLKYRRSVIESSRLQIVSMHKRAQNLIALTFNLVTQRDSQIMQLDSYSMHVIAALGLVLIPVASLSSLVQTPYFQIADDYKRQVQLSIGSFLAISAAITLFVLAIWWVFRSSWVRNRRGRV